MLNQLIKKISDAYKLRKQRKDVYSLIFWMLSWEFQELEKIKEGFNEMERIDSIFLSPGTWLAVANPTVFELSKLIDLRDWSVAFSGAVWKIERTQASLKMRQHRPLIQYLEERIEIMNARFDWANHHEREVGPKEAIEAKFETERELRSMIRFLKEEYERIEAHPYI